MNMNKNNSMLPGKYETPECDVLALETGTAVLNKGSLSKLHEGDEEDW